VEDQKDAQCFINRLRRQDGFILPLTMMLAMLFTFYTLNAIERINSERDFFQERKASVQLDWKKKCAAADLIQLINQGTPKSTGELHDAEWRVVYRISRLSEGVHQVSATLHYKNHQDDFLFIYNENTKAITKWVD
jgi:hypothetical protein